MSPDKFAWILTAVQSLMLASIPIVYGWTMPITEWTMTGKSPQQGDIIVPFKSPGYVFTALHKVGVVKHPWHMFEERESAWVHNSTWQLLHSTEIPASAQRDALIQLELTGVDGPASIRVSTKCGESEAEMHNSFRCATPLSFGVKCNDRFESS